MKKQLCIFAAAVLVLSGCQKKAQTTDETAKTDSVAVATTEIETGNTAGAFYTDITGVTADGKELSLSQVVGKTDYVLVDFWASWCGPCRRFIPVLKEIYASQPEGHFQILSCSVDRDPIAWQVALGEESMPWLQMREDETHPCSDKYDVQFIPHTVLIDREGKIVGVNLEEPEIAEILFGEE